jgi:hypothetical protein
MFLFYVACVPRVGIPFDNLSFWLIENSPWNAVLIDSRKENMQIVHWILEETHIISSHVYWKFKLKVRPAFLGQGSIFLQSAQKRYF